MSELMNKVTKDNLRAEMNLIFSMMRFISMLLDMARDSPDARETLTVTVDGLFERAAVLFRDVNAYAEKVSKAEERVSATG